MQKPFKYHQVLSELIKKFPFGFSRNPRNVVPLGTNTLPEIIRILGVDGEAINHYRLALEGYRNSNAYLTAVALGRKRRNLFGEKFPAHIPPFERDLAKEKLQKRGAWSDALEQLYRSKIGHFVHLESNSPSKNTHSERHERWLERLRSAGFNTADIERIQTDGLQTDDLEETRRLLDMRKQPDA